ncbi:MAG TPA: cell envelope integrity protein TolA [Candidatus Binatia bacterium]|nr:cell envelope integrity protein TolA [Candidatus Binatia bacterium]
MAKSQLKPMPYLGRPEGPSDGVPRVWKWVILSGIAHIVVVTVVLIVPIFGPNPKNTPPPVYTVDLMGGEKLGGGAGTSLKPVPAPKPEPLAPEEKSAPPVQETKKAKEPPKPTPEEVKEAKDKAAAERAEMIEKVKAKKEAEEKRKKEAEEKRLANEKAEAERRARLEELNKKRKEAALADLRAKLEERQRQQALEEKLQQQRLLEQQRAAEQQRAQQQATSTVAGNTPGAAGPGVGGTGGGIVKSPEFIRYQNIIQERVRSSWTWVGRRNDLKVTVNASIQENGEITGLKLVGTSGDRSFDDSVLRALRKASPLPPPPAEFRKEFSNVILPFNSEELGR